MTCRDWRGVSAAVTAPLYRAEIQRWSSLLHWDTRATWRQVESARATGALPGTIAEDASGVCGWTFQLVHRDCLQVGAVVASSAETTDALIDHVMRSEEARSSTSTLVFACAAAPQLEHVLESHGFIVERYRYMECSLDAEPARSGGLATGRTWTADDSMLVAALMALAYHEGSPARPFAREGDAASWDEYTRQLTETTGCGVFMPHLSVIVPAEDGSTLQAAVLTTAVGAGTGHLAQVMVAPSASRAGLGRGAVLTALSRLREAGFTRATLLVGARNLAAERLYRGLGFVETAVFVSATMDQPRRSTSDALATVDASTFR